MPIDDVAALRLLLHLAVLLALGQLDVVLVLEHLQLHEPRLDPDRPAPGEREHDDDPRLEAGPPAGSNA